MNLKKILFVALVLGALLLFVYKVEVPHEEAKQQEGLFLAPTEKDAISKIRITRPESNVELRKIGTGTGVDAWSLLSAPKSLLDAGAVNAVISGLQSLKLEKPIVPEQAEDIGVYGLKEGDLQVAVDTPEGSKILQLGKKSDFLNLRYAKVSGKPEIYLVADTLFPSLNKSADEFRSKTPVSIEQSKIQKLVVEASTGRTELEQDTQGSWKVVAPAQATGSTDTVGELLRKLRAIRVKGFFDAPNNDPAKKNLAQPQVRITAYLKENAPTPAPSSSDVSPIVISLSQWKDGEAAEQRVMAISGQDSLFLLEPGFLNDFDKGTSDLRETKLFEFENWDTTEFTVSPKGSESIHGVHSPVKEGDEGSSDGWVINEKEGDPTFITDYLSTVSQTRASGFPQGEVDSTIKESLVDITLRTGKDKTRIFHIGRSEASPNLYVVVQEGKTEPFYITKDQFEKLIPKKEVLAKLEKKSEDSKASVTPTPVSSQ